MGVYNFIVDAHQSGQIDELEERIAKLEEQTQILYEWVLYYRGILNERCGNEMGGQENQSNL
jgi:hypothetical protein